MNRHSRLTRALAVLALGAGLTIGLSLPVFAAVDASIAPAAGAPGDRLVLTTGEPKNPQADAGLEGQTRTVYLINFADFEAQTRRYKHQVCGTQGDHALGSLSWRNGIGSLDFRIPNVPAGEYYFQVRVLNVSPDCWRIGSATELGPLVLTVTSAAADGQSSSPSPPAIPTGVTILIAVMALALVAIASAWVARATR
jgi:hypothetical protein